MRLLWLKRGAGHTTQLLADNTAGPQPLLRQSSAAAAPGVFGAAIGGSNAAALLARGEAAAAAAPAAVQYEDCTTKLLADSTAASACGVMGLFALPRPGLLGGTIAGGAPVVEPARQQEQQEYASPELGTDGGGARNLSRAAFGLPALPAFGLNAVPGSAGGAAGDTGNAGFAAAAAAPAGAAAADLSAAGCSLQGQGQRKTPSRAQHMRQVAAASPAGPAGMEQGSEPTLELAAAASQGGQTNALEDATLEDFELPPALAAGEERPITMPFSGATGLGSGRAWVALHAFCECCRVLTCVCILCSVHTVNQTPCALDCTPCSLWSHRPAYARPAKSHSQLPATPMTLLTQQLVALTSFAGLRPLSLICCLHANFCCRASVLAGQ